MHLPPPFPTPLPLLLTPPFSLATDIGLGCWEEGRPLFLYGEEGGIPLKHAQWTDLSFTSGSVYFHHALDLWGHELVTLVILSLMCQFPHQLIIVLTHLFPFLFISYFFKEEGIFIRTLRAFEQRLAGVSKLFVCLCHTGGIVVLCHTLNPL